MTDDERKELSARLMDALESRTVAQTALKDVQEVAADAVALASEGAWQDRMWMDLFAKAEERVEFHDDFKESGFLPGALYGIDAAASEVTASEPQRVDPSDVAPIVRTLSHVLGLCRGSELSAVLGEQPDVEQLAYCADSIGDAIEQLMRMAGARPEQEL
jgi:hypothetical protein